VSPIISDSFLYNKKFFLIFWEMGRWFDVDILLMNPKIPLEIFLPPPATYPSINCLVTDDHRGLNNGVFFLRVDHWSVWLMTAVLGYQKVGCRPPGKLRTEDQGALENILREVSLP
jgi:hypothetical protein